MATTDLSWAVPVMRAGYAGRGLTYLAVAGISLWAVRRGGEAQGTGTAFSTLENSAPGTVVLLLIAVGLLAYAVWRVICAWHDLEDYGDEGKGLVARAGQATTGLIHGALGIAALLVVLTASGSEGDSGIVRATAWIMSKPGGVVLVGLAGLLTFGAGLYYLHKGWSGRWRERLMANRFTSRWSAALMAGVMAQGAVVGIVGAFLLVAALRSDPSEAGGLDKAFEWVSAQAYGQVLVTLLCLGLLGFALFCFVNAAYRIVPRAAGDRSFETLADALRRL